MARRDSPRAGVRLLKRRPPDTLLCGAKVSHEVKCFSVGHRLISVPISERSRKSVVGANAIIVTG